MRTLIQTVAAVILVLLSTGCATITRGTTEAYVVETKPPGADVKSSSGWTCTTPCSVKVKRRGDFVLTIMKPSYETVTASVTSSVDGAGAAGMAGNVLLGGIIGAGVDAGTGSMHSHKPNPLVVEMVEVGTAASKPTVVAMGGLSSVQTPPPDLRAISQTEKENCEFIRQVTKGAGGSGDTSENLERAMSSAMREADGFGANSYFLVDTTTTATGASVVLEALVCP